jgi:predicted PurR-regulated permease PerM
MAVTFIQQKKTQKYLIAILILVVLAVLLVFWFGFLSEDAVQSQQEPSVFSHREIQIDFEALDNPILDKFYFFEKIGPFEGEKGRENPFLPY